VSWEKVGVTVVCKPVAHSSGIYVRIPKRVAQAYDLFTADEVEVTVERARRSQRESELHTSAKVCNSGGER